MPRRTKGKKTVICMYNNTQLVDSEDKARKNFRSQIAGGMSDIECFDISTPQGKAKYYSKQFDKIKKEMESFERELKDYDDDTINQAKAVNLMSTNFKIHSNEMKSIGKMKRRR